VSWGNNFPSCLRFFRGPFSGPPLFAAAGQRPKLFIISFLSRTLDFSNGDQVVIGLHTTSQDWYCFKFVRCHVWLEWFLLYIWWNVRGYPNCLESSHLRNFKCLHANSLCQNCNPTDKEHLSLQLCDQLCNHANLCLYCSGQRSWGQNMWNTHGKRTWQRPSNVSATLLLSCWSLFGLHSWRS